MFDFDRLTIDDVSRYYGRRRALSHLSLTLQPRQLVALLGPNGAGKTTLISIICGIAQATRGSVSVAGFDIRKDYRKTRSMIGLVPQELTTDSFESVWSTVSFSRGLFGKSANSAHIEKILRDLSLWDKKDDKIMTLSGGMKRRLLIAKALSHEPTVLFLDEPTNHLDLEATIWLESFLTDWKGGMVLISHDRAFLDRSVNHILEIDLKKITLYHGNYSKYKKDKALRLEQHRNAYKNQQKQIKDTERFIERFRYKNTCLLYTSPSPRDRG